MRASILWLIGITALFGCGSPQQPVKANAKQEAAKEQVDRAMIECAQEHGQTPEVKEVTVVIRLDAQGHPTGVDFHPKGGEMAPDLASCLDSRFRAIGFPVPAEAGETMSFTMKYD